MTLTRIEKLTSEMDILLTTTEYIPNCEIISFMGIVSGNSILDLNDTKLNIKNKKASFEKICPTILNDARDVAIKKMAEDAIEADADAVINIKIETNVVGKVIEFYAYGTAVSLLAFDDEDFTDDDEDFTDDDEDFTDDDEESMDEENKCICA